MERESKNERFCRLAEKRVGDLIDKFRLIGNLADRRNYAYSDEQAKQILRAIESEFRDLKQKFFNESGDRAKDFRLNRDSTI